MKIKHLTESLNKKYALEEKNVIKKRKSLQESTSNTIKDYSWSKFLDKVEAATGFKVDSAYRRGYDQWIELIDDQGKIRDAEITKYFDGEYELNLSNISTYIHEEYSLVGQDGNAFSLIGYTARCMKECGLRDEINEMRERAMSGDYYNLIAVCDEYIQKCNEINPDLEENFGYDYVNAKSLYEKYDLNEMALGEMSLQSPARTIKNHISYNNKYSIQDIQNLMNLAFEKVYNDNYPHERFSRTIKSIASILLSDFENDIDEWSMREGLTDSEAKEIINHYNKYVIEFKNFYDKCESECSIDPSDKDFIQLRDAAKFAYEEMYNGMRSFLDKEFYGKSKKWL